MKNDNGLIHRAKQNAALLRHLVRLSWQVGRAASITTGILFVVVVFGGAGIAQVQRWVIDGLRTHAAEHSSLTWLLVPVAVAAFAQAAAGISTRVAANRREGLVQKITVELSEEVLGYVAHVPTIEHLERSDYLDRVCLVSRGTPALATYGWSIAETGACLMMIAMSVWLLVLVHPALAVLGLTTLPVLLLAGRGQSALRKVHDVWAEVTRLEADLTGLCLDPDAAKEIRIAGSGPELSARAARLWGQVTDAQRRTLIRGALREAAGWLCYLLGLGGALALVAREVIAGRIGGGALVLVVSLSAQLRMQLWGLRMNYGKAAEAGGVARHYLWLRDYVSGLDDVAESVPVP